MEMAYKEQSRQASRGVALIMVLLVLSVLAIVGAPFAISMMLHERAARRFEGNIKAYHAAKAAINHAISHLARTLAAEESDAEAVELEEKRPPDPSRKSSYQPAPRDRYGRVAPRAGRKNSPHRQGLVVRRDLGEKSAPRRRQLGRMDGRANAARGRSVTTIDNETPSFLIESKVGPSAKMFDPPADLEMELPPDFPYEDPDDPEGEAEITFQSRGLSGTFSIEDEQGKVNLNSAPPNLLGNLVGSSRLAAPLAPGAMVLTLEDAAPFRTDFDDRSIDGAVVIVHPQNARVEAVTYTLKRGQELHGLFRGAFFSLPAENDFPIGSAVYDLRGWKAGHHALRAHADGGFSPAKLAEFSTIEELRGIASWQISSLFLIRFRGEGLTAEFLQKNGINARKLEELGLDPALFEGGDSDGSVKDEYDAAVKALKRQRVSGGTIEAIRKARGARGVIAFESRVASLKPAEASKAAEELKKSLERDRRNAPRIERQYLEAVLANLGDVYSRPGIETFLPEEMAILQDLMTVSSLAPAKWSEAQSNPDRLPAGPAWGESFRVARGGELGGGALVRIRSAKNLDEVEFNRLSYHGKSAPMRGFQLAYPLQRDYPPHEARIDAQVRHPINVNTAPERVLKAVFTGLRGYRTQARADTEKTKRKEAKANEKEKKETEKKETEKKSEKERDGDDDGDGPVDFADDSVVTPVEASRLAQLVVSRRPLKGHDEFRDLLFDAARAGDIEEVDIEPLFLNAIQPNDPRLKVSTTGLCYTTGDIYTIEATGVVRSDAGTMVAESRLRELVEISSPEPLRLGLFNQFDYQSELVLKDPFTALAPEDHALYAVGFPGVRSHLVDSRPLLLRGSYIVDASLNLAPPRFPMAGGEMGWLKLANSESRTHKSTWGTLRHFRNTLEGYELGAGEPYIIDITLDQGSGGGAAAGGIPGGVGMIDLTSTPGAIDFMVRFRTFPEATNKEGMVILIDAGADEERNRISLLYDRSRSEFVARIYDSSLPDPSIIKGRQFIEIRARRPLDLETWYHLRLAWDGAYAGGIALFIDGLPVGTAGFATELASDLQTQGAGALSLKDPSAFPYHPGEPIAVRVGSELIEIKGNQIRQQPPSEFSKWRAVREARLGGTQTAGAMTNPPVPGSPSGANAADRANMRGPWNQRASSPGRHPKGTVVTPHGYSLPIERKIRDKFDHEHQVSYKGTCAHNINHGTCDQRVWTPGGLALADRLLTWENFPPGVLHIVHYAPEPPPPTGGAGGAGGRPGGGRGGGSGPAGGTASGSITKFIAPMFHIDLATGANLLPAGAGGAAGGKGGGGPSGGAPFFGSLRVFSAEIQWGGQTYNAADFFQTEGVLMAHLTKAQSSGPSSSITPDLHYEKDRLPEDHPAAQANAVNSQGEVFPRISNNSPVVIPQRTGLRIVAWYPVTNRIAAPGIRGGGANRLPQPAFLADPHAELRPISVLLNGPAEHLYPLSGIIEVRGSPPPWGEAGDPQRPDLSAAPLFEHHPDDTVEWIRFVDIVPGKMGGILVGRTQVSGSNHRGYPDSSDYLKNQMFHRAGDQARLVMELSAGGAGYGDYVSIASDDPAVAEPIVRRVYNVSERNDGRFFVSLIDVDESGREMGSALSYLLTYTHNMNPRLVKFPSGALPQVATGRLILFGESGSARSRPAGAPRMARQSLEEEESVGTIVDEIRMSINRWQGMPLPGRGQRIRHVLVPLQGGKVQYEPMGAQHASISGIITEGQAITPQNPLEILVVSVGKDPDLFAPKLKRGLLRIGEEVFAYENPSVADGEGDGGGIVTVGGSGPQAGQGTGEIGKRWPSGEDEETARKREQDAAEREERRRRGQEQTPGTPASAATTQRNQTYQPDSAGERQGDARFVVSESPPVANIQGNFEREGFARIDDRYESLHGFYEIFYYQQFTGGTFQRCLRGQFQTAIVAQFDTVPQDPHKLVNVTTKLRLIGRSCMGTQRTGHGLGDPVNLLPYMPYTEITGQLTGATLPVDDTDGFPPVGYLLLDSNQPGRPFEIMAYTRVEGKALIRRPTDEDGNGILRACFGTVEQPVGPGMFAYALPFRHFDRYQPLTESENLAYLQKSFRVPGAHWRSVRWRIRKPRGGQERLCDIVVAARIDGAPDWSAKPTNQKGGLFFFEDASAGDSRSPDFPVGVHGDEIELRVYFRYKNGSFQRVSDDHYRDDWKETPVLEWISVEYEKAGQVIRHEEPSL